MTELREDLQRLSPLQRAVFGMKQLRARLDALEQAATEPIAIIGMACRFPGGADTPEQFWHLLRGGVDAVGEITPDRWDVDAYYDPDPERSGKIYTRQAALIRDVDLFDASFFNISPREAQSLDPQQRLLLTVAWEALEDAGQNPAELKNSQTAVFVGIGQFDYAQRQMNCGEPERINAHDGSGNALCFASGRLSYFLGLQGPSIALDTACSSSLVSVHLACESLRSGEADLGIAGGVQLILSPEATVFLCRAKALSADGRCKTFDAAADGYGRGEGCGVVVLKRVSDAVANGDNVLAIIRGTAVNHDGPSSGLTVPNAHAQQLLLRRALEKSRVEPRAVEYVEAHGTGTALGDPIEARALDAVFSEERSPNQPLIIGSVKTNIGHLEAAAGIASLIKVVLAMQHEEIPRHLHFNNPSSYIPWSEMRLSVAAESLPWTRGTTRRIAGVSSFGISGTNCHAIIEEAPVAAPVPASASTDSTFHLFTISGRSHEALLEFAGRYEQMLADGSHDLASICYSTNVCRAHFEHRLCVVANSTSQLLDDLRAVIAGRMPQTARMGRVTAGEEPRIAFVFGSRSSGWQEVARELIEMAPVFRRSLETCAATVDSRLGCTLFDLFLEGRSISEDAPARGIAAFAFELALAELWMSWGILPSAVIGFDFGEYVAACIAGVLTVEDAIELLLARDQGRGVHDAAHSPPYLRPTSTFISGITGTPASSDLQTPEYWARVAPRPEQFAAGLAFLRKQGYDTFLEITFDSSLISMSRTDEALWLASVRPGVEGRRQLLESLGALYERGARVAWGAVAGARGGRRVALPHYPFQRQRYWVEEGRRPAAGGRRGVAELVEAGASEELRARLTAQGVAPAAVEAVVPVLLAEGARARAAAAVGAWWYGIDWVRAARPEPAAVAAGRWVVLTEPGGLGEALAAAWTAAGAAVVRGYPGATTGRHGDGAWTVARDGTDFAAVLRAAAGDGVLAGVVHTWSLAAAPADTMTVADLGAAQRLGCDSVRWVSAALVAQGSGRLWVVTRDAVEAGGSRLTGLAQAPVWGLGTVVGLEQPAHWGGLIDLDVEDGGASVAGLLAALAAGAGEQVALRGGARYVARVGRRVPAATAPPWPIHAEGTYVLTGGTGALGQQTAAWLVAQGARQLVLTSRQGTLPAAALAALRASGARVAVVAADVTDAAAMAAVLAAHAPVRGVVHAAGIAGPTTAVTALSAAALDATLAAKVQGSWVLHTLTADRGVDLFVGFSSIAAVWGSKGQAAYAAGNRFVDMLAHYRRARGAAGVSVAWGPWSGGGLASAAARAHLARLGVTALTPAEGQAALTTVRGSGAVQLTVAAVAWPQFKAVYDARGPRPLLAAMAAAPPAAPAPAAPAAARPPLAAVAPAARPAAVQAWVQTQVAAVLGWTAPPWPAPDQGFFELGLDSLLAVELQQRLTHALDLPLPTTVAFDHPTIERLAAHLVTALGWSAAATPAAAPRVVDPADPIAIVAMACRFPGADDPEAFWGLLHAGGDAVGPVPADRWNADAYYTPQPGTPGKIVTREGGFLRDVAGFDAAFFGIAPREALSMDPQQRLLLETSWAVLERAGQPPDRARGRATGVFVGVTHNDYERLLMASGADDIDPYFVTGNALNATAGRVSYMLGLQGPSLAVDTACSSSLVAVHLACQSLRQGECEQALAGAVNLMVTPVGSIATSRAGMLSPSGRCKTFDRSADGYGRGEGCGVVLLKRLGDAQRAGDPVLAVIRGSAVNQDGASSGFTVPNGPAQQAVIRDALARADVEPGAVDYVEAHGTGTALGDPIEIEALAAVFGTGRDRPLWVGSVKTNVGHMEAAAGMGGLIKTVLALQHDEIPRHRNCHALTPHVPWDTIPIRVVTAPQPWPRAAGARLAGVSSFGLSGTNAHVVVAEAPAPPPRPVATADRPWHLLTLSAKTPDALHTLAARYAAHLRAHPDLDLADVCFTANARRVHHAERLAVIAGDLATLAERLTALDATARGRAPTTPPPVRWVFPDAADPGAVARAVYDTQPAFRARLDECAALWHAADADHHWTALLAGTPDAAGHCALQIALAALWRSWGVTPAAVTGHGLGDLAAAVVAGVLPLPTALTLAALPRAERAAGIAALDRSAPQLPFEPDAATAAAWALPPAPEPAPLADALVVPMTLTAAPAADCPWPALLAQLATLYRHGVPLDWPALDRDVPRRVVPLPTYPFQHRRLWPALTAAMSAERRDAPTSSQHLLLGHRIQSAIAGDRLEFEIRPNEELRPYAHAVLGTHVLSSAACLEIALAAGVQVLRSDRLVLENVTFREPIVLDKNQAGPLRLVLTRVDSATYSFEIFRRADDANEPSWMVKASGTIHAESVAPPDAPRDLARAQVDHREQISVDEFYAALAARGVEYAPCAHSVEQLWVGPGRALGRVRVPIDFGRKTDSGTFHPSLLDGCLQVVAAALPERLRNTTFIHVAVDRMRLYAGPGPLLWSEARVEENGDGRTQPLRASVRLFDSEGRIVAELEDILLKQVDPEALASSASDSFRSWLYEVAWRAVPADGRGVAADVLAAPSVVVEQVRRGGGLTAGPALAAYDTALRDLEDRSIGYVQRAFAALGWTGRVGDRTTTAALQQRLAIVPRYARFLARLLAMLAETGWLRQHDDEWEVLRGWTEAGDGPDRRGIPDPSVEVEWQLLERCGTALPAVLRGTCDPVELLFPAGDLQTAASLYRDAPGAQVMNGLVQQGVAAAVRDWPAGRGLRVLEIGGGTGGTTRAVLAALPATHTDYTFTDISPRFVTAGEALGAAWGGRLHGAVLDIERRPAAQGVHGPYDLVIAANVLHATRDLRDTLQHVREVLAPGGVLVLLEATVPTRFIDLIFGVTEGWWRFADPDLRAAHPLLGADQWTALLEANGFAPAAALTAPDGTAGEVLARQAVIVAQMAAAAPEPRAPRAWLILADEGGVGAALATRLRDRGDQCRLLYAAPGPADGRERVAADRPAPLAEVIATAGPLHAVVHLWSLDTASTDQLTPVSLRAGCAHSCGSALHLTQALISHSAHPTPPRLYLVTRGAQPVDSHAGSVAVVQAPIGGLAKTIAREHPDFRCVAIDLDPRESAPAAALFDEIWSAANDREEQIALRRGVKYVSRLVSKRADDCAPVTLVPNATYLVTGATRGIGLKVARWMSDHGARHLLLLARRPADDTAVQGIRELQERGTDVRVVHGDVADTAHVRGVLNAIRQSTWPLKGVIHCAGVFQDKLLADHQWELFDEVFAAKISGSWNLHALTQDMELDFFVMFSSAAALFGAAGLANYVAANEFMDRLAQHRATQNLPTLSVNWGPWLGTGMAQAVTAKRASQWTSAGIEQLSSHAALRALEYLMGLPATQAAVIKADWSKVRDQFARGTEPRFLELVSTDSPAINTRTYDVRTALEAAAPVDRRELLTSHVRAVVARVLGLDSADSLDPHRGLFEAGLDSLASMELRNQLQASLGCTLGSTFAFMYPNLDALVNHLATAHLGFEDSQELERSDVQVQVTPAVRALHSTDRAESLDLRIARELEALESLLN